MSVPSECRVKDVKFTQPVVRGFVMQNAKPIIAWAPVNEMPIHASWTPWTESSTWTVPGFGSRIKQLSAIAIREAGFAGVTEFTN